MPQFSYINSICAQYIFKHRRNVGRIAMRRMIFKDLEENMCAVHDAQ